MQEILNNWVILINDWIWTFLIIVPLICTGLYFTFRSRFVQFRKIKEMSRLLGEGVAGNNSKNTVSSFQAFVLLQLPGLAQVT